MELRGKARGERHVNAKLTEAAVIGIRTRYPLGVSMAQLAREFGVTPQAVRNVLLGKSWAHVQQPAEAGK